MHAEARRQPWLLRRSHPLFFFLFKSLAGLELNKWASLGASDPHDPLVSASPAWGLQVHPITPGFFFECGCSGLRAGLTELLPPAPLLPF